MRGGPIRALIGAILLAAVTAGGYVYWDHAGHFEATDDAFVEARQFAVAPKVSGYITAVPVTDNQHVAAGDVIARIDDRDYRVALAQAEAQVAAAKANVENIAAQITVQQAQVDASRAQVERAQAALTYAEQQATRYQELADRAAGTVQMAQQTASTLRQDQAAVRDAMAAVTVAERRSNSTQSAAQQRRGEPCASQRPARPSAAQSLLHHEASWVVTTYLIANAVILTASSFLAKMFGRKSFFVAALALFTVSSLLCAFAWNIQSLLLFRVLQGLGGGGMVPVSQSILADSFPPAKRGQGFALFGIAVVVAPVVGPTLGGWLSDNYGWEWCFLINGPVGLLSMVLVYLILREPKAAVEHARR